VNKYEIDGKTEGVLQTFIPAFEIAWEDAKKMVDLIHQGEIIYANA